MIRSGLNESIHIGLDSYIPGRPDVRQGEAWDVSLVDDRTNFRGERSMRYRLELTDTFAGEANYSWVKRGQLAASADMSRLAIVRRAKKWAGLSGVRCRVNDYGDAIDIRPHGLCIVLFATWSE